MTKIAKSVDAGKISASIEALNEEPNNESLLLELSDTFKAVGIIQAAVITYAPYISLLLPYELFENHRK